MDAAEVEREDLEYITDRLEDEFFELSGKKVLITGGAGFLGYYLTKSVLFWNEQHPDQAPIDLFVLDNFRRGVPGWITELQASKGRAVHILNHDISNPLPDPSLRFSYIMHAASIASPHYYRLHPIETMDANVNGLRHLLEHILMQQATAEPCTGFLFFSSSEIYGDPTPGNIPTAESYRGEVSCVGPRACYDESKRYGETLCVNFARQHHLPIKIVRPFNNYGPGLKISDKRVVPDFAKNIFNGEDIVVFSDGTPTRTFSYVADDIVGYYKILIHGTPGEAYNIGADDEEITIGELAERVRAIAEQHFGYTGTIVFQKSPDKDYLTDNPNRRAPVLTKIRRELGFSPTIDMASGLLRTLCWYRENLGEGDEQ